MEHIRCSVNYTMTHLGVHKLPLIGRADWNDCLNLNCFSQEPGGELPDLWAFRRTCGRIGFHWWDVCKIRPRVCGVVPEGWAER